MSLYRMQDGTVIDTTKSTNFWTEAEDWNGQNHISRNTGQQWTHQTLYRSRKGRYYVEHFSQYQGSKAHAEWVSPEEAVRWLALNGCAIPDELAHLTEEITD